MLYRSPVPTFWGTEVTQTHASPPSTASPGTRHTAQLRQNQRDLTGSEERASFQYNRKWPSRRKTLVFSKTYELTNSIFCKTRQVVRPVQTTACTSGKSGRK